MKRLDSNVSIMVATEEEAERVEVILENGPLLLCTSDEPGRDGFFVVVLEELEEFAPEAEKVLKG